MTIISDDFNRANGPLGASWTTTQGDPSIVDGKATGDSGSAVFAAFAAEDPVIVTSHFSAVAINQICASPLVKASVTQLDGYGARITTFQGGFYTFIQKWSNGTPSSLSFVEHAGWVPGDVTVGVGYNAGMVTIYVDGAAYESVVDNTFAANTAVGLIVANTFVPTDSWDASDSAIDRSIDVQPDPLWVGGGMQLLTVTGTNTVWTEGEPGDTTFTADHGTVEMQQVLSGTSAEIMYTPDEWIGPITFHESKYGLEDTINAVAVMPPGYPGGFGCLLTEPGAAIVNRTGASHLADDAELLTSMDVVTLNPYPMGYSSALSFLVSYVLAMVSGTPPPSGTNYPYELLRWVSGDYLYTQPTPQPPTQTTIKQDLAAILQGFVDLRAPASWTLGELLAGLGGEPLASHQDILSAITAIPVPDIAQVLFRLDQIQGFGGWSLELLALRLQEIMTASDYNLGTVVARLDDRPTTANMNAAFAITNGAIGGLALEIAAIGAAETADAASSAAAAASGATVLGWILANGGTILDTLNQLKELLAHDTTPVYAPPVWPGEPNVVWGDAIAIESNVPVAGPMDGVVVEVTGCESGTRFFDYDGIRAYSHLGALAFESDHGDLEPFQPLGYVHGVYVPKTIYKPIACRLYRSRNVRGTIRPWTIKPA